MTTGPDSPDDQPDEIWVGPVGPIPVFDSDDFRLDDDRTQAREAARTIDSLMTNDELLTAFAEAAEPIRWRVVDRLIARARDDERTIPALLSALRTDPSWRVRDATAMALAAFAHPDVREALTQATRDENADVRWSAKFALSQMDET